MKRLAGAFREIDRDNQLIRKDIPEKWIGKFIDEIKQKRSPFLKPTANLMSTSEVGKLMQLPTAELQREYPQINSINKPEVSLPESLFMKCKGIDIGWVTEKGSTRMARIPNPTLVCNSNTCTMHTAWWSFHLGSQIREIR